MAILKLDPHNEDEDKEIEFELDYLTSLTTSQRFEMMFTKTKEMLSLRKKRKTNRAVTEVIKRKPR
jgi:DNA mismatch repair protein MutH